MNLRKYLKLKGIKITFFSRKLGITYPTLFRYMSGSQPTPRHIKLAVRQLTDGKVTKVEDKPKLKKTIY